MSNSLDPNQADIKSGPDLGLSCSERLSEKILGGKELIQFLANSSDSD